MTQAARPPRGRERESSSSAGTEGSAKREAILDAALELFSERGFYGTAVPAVAEHAKVGAGTVYRYFDSKEALVNALYRREKQAFMMHLVVDFPMDAPPRQQFRELWNRLWSYSNANARSAMFLELQHHASYLDEESRALEDRAMAPMIAFVAEAQAKQALKPLDPLLIIAFAYGTYIQIAKGAWSGRFSPTREHLDAAEACVWEAVRL